MCGLRERVFFSNFAERTSNNVSNVHVKSNERCTIPRLNRAQTPRRRVSALQPNRLLVDIKTSEIGAFQVVTLLPRRLPEEPVPHQGAMDPAPTSYQHSPFRELTPKAAWGQAYLYPTRSNICCTLVMFFATTSSGTVSALKCSPPMAFSAGLSIFTPLAAANSLLPLAK